MIFKFSLAVVSMALFATVTSRKNCDQNFNMRTSISFQENVSRETKITHTNYPIIKYKVSARRLTGRNRDEKLVKIDPFPKIFINSRNRDKEPINDDNCFLKANQNPNWRDEFSVKYESIDTYLEVEIRDNVESGSDYSLGIAFVHVRNMLCVGRPLEYPLWNHINKENDNMDDFYTGSVLITTVSISDPSVIDCD